MEEAEAPDEEEEGGAEDEREEEGVCLVEGFEGC